jgi:hypothetical protein
VQSTSNLGTAFVDESPLITQPGAGESAAQFDITIPANTASQFFRVRIVE